MVDQSLPLVTDVRDENGPDGAFSNVTSQNSGNVWQGGELQWLNNEPGVSCIPEGEYLVQMQSHPKHGNLGDLVGMPGMCYEVMNVPGRSAILIHIANWAGQESEGEKSDLLGCIGLGKDRAKTVPPGYTATQEEIEHSTQAITEFYKEMGGKDFRLRITNAFAS